MVGRENVRGEKKKQIEARQFSSSLPRSLMPEKMLRCQSKDEDEQDEHCQWFSHNQD